MSWLGIKGVFSTLTKGTLPTVDGEPVPFDVWLSPSLPAWDYEPVDGNGPYRLARIDPKRGTVYGYVESASFTAIVNDFAAQHMPRRKECCYVLDRHCNIVIGWSWNGDGFEWEGCQQAFNALAAYHPVNAAIWERQAYQHHRQDDINLEEWL